jgi:NADPH2:quinone reductase
MKAIVLKKYGAPSECFEMQDRPDPQPAAGQVLIDVAYSGLNFADVMAIKGLYNEAPPLPCVLGYDVSGKIAAVGENVTGLALGDRVIGMTRFGGYAEKVAANAAGVVKIPANWNPADAIALTTQYCTAFYAAGEAMNLHEGDKVLIQAGAGGVGIALVQYCLYKGCEIFATTSSPEKMEFLKQMGVQHPINYQQEDFAEAVKRINGKGGIDAVFDAIGGASVKKGMGLLRAGGRLVCYGASVLSSKKGLAKIGAGLAFGFYHPAMLMMPSKSIIGVNMLKIADMKPALMQYCLQQVVALAESNVFKLQPATVFAAKDIALAHEFLASRKSIGKVVISW